MAKTAFFIATGSELLSFKPSLYAPVFSEKLEEFGVKLTGEMTVGDDLASIKKAAVYALNGGWDIIICCGGLGPTFDDLTRQAFSETLRVGLVRSDFVEKILKKRYGLKKLTPNLYDQCLVLKGAALFENPNGTAFGQAVSSGGKEIILLPGPRNEWEAVWGKGLDRHLAKKAGRARTRKHRFKIADMKEMEVQKVLEPLMRKYPGAAYTVLAGPAICEFSLRTEGPVSGKFAEIKKAAVKLLGDRVYGEGSETLAGNLGEELKKRRRTICAAESCTGGLAASLITDVPGSSDYFKGGINAYSNSAKTGILGVKKRTLEKFGAVSPECAVEMASSARKLFGADYAFSITGIAGPGGGTEEKPVGLVYFGLSSSRGIRAFYRNFRGPRVFIKNCSANIALYEVLKLIKYREGVRQ